MTIKNFITKGILPILLIGIITWLGQYIFMVDGSIDWFRFMLVYGVPIGIPYMFIIIPARWDLSGTIGMVAMCCDRSCIWFYCYDWNWDTGSLVCDCISSK